MITGDKNDMELAPIVLFVYNRPWHAAQALAALEKNEQADQSVLYIYADGPKENASGEELQKITEVRNVIRSRQWCREVIIVESPQNKGLANSVIDAVTEVIAKHGKIIVLEDDLLTSVGFLKYMNTALDKYSYNDEVMQVSGFMFPNGLETCNTAFFLPFTTSWGWATWSRAWKQFDVNATGYDLLKTDIAMSKRFDLDGTYPYTEMMFAQMEQHSINSWAIRWWWSVFRKEGVTLFPDSSLIKNIGFGKESTHTSSLDPYKDTEFSSNYFIKYFPNKIIINQNLYSNVKVFFSNSKTQKIKGVSFSTKVRNKLLKLLKLRSSH